MATEVGWLVELKRPAPLYFRMGDEDDWTEDHLKALRFARKEDAEHVIKYYGWTEATAVEHSWG